MPNVKFPAHIFKAYDIRGLVDTELTADLYYRIGRAAVVYSGAKRVCVGYDIRPSSIPYKEALIRGVLDQGGDALDIGLVSTPILNIMTIRDETVDLGMMVTASHNPQEYNGCKFVHKRTMMPIGLDSGLDRIRDMVEKYEFVDAAPGAVTTADVTTPYLDFICSLVNLGAIKPLKVVIDTGNGIEGVLIDDLLGRVPVRPRYLFKEPDGRFPNHEPNPIKHETLKDLQREVVASGAHMGFAFDGDADRIGLVDETGAIIPGDLILALLVRALVPGEEKPKVLYDLRSSLVVKEVTEELGGQAIETRVGRAHIIQEMRKEAAVLGGELSNHFYFRDTYGFESGDLTLLCILQLVSQSNQTLSALMADLRRYYHSGEINFEVTDKDGIIKRLEKQYSEAAKRVSKLDGIKIEFADWWFNVRKSNTEPLLRLVLEAKTKELMEEKVREVRGVIEEMKEKAK